MLLRRDKMHYFHNLQRWIANLSLRKKLYISCVFLSSIIFLTSAFVGLQNTSNAFNELLAKSIHTGISSSAGTTSHALSDILAVTSMMIADDTVQRNLYAINHSDPIDQVQALEPLRASVTAYWTMYKNKHVLNITLFTNHSYVYGDATYFLALPNEIQEDIVNSARELEGRPYWCTDYIDEHSLILARTIRDTKHGKFEDIGTVLIHIDMNSLAQDAVRFSNRYSECTYQIYDDDKLLYTSDPASPADIAYDSQALEDGYDIFEANGHRYFAVADSIPDFSWDYLCLMDYDSTWETQMRSYITYGITILLALTLTIIIVYFTIRRTLMHTYRLIEKMKNYRGTDSNLTIPDPEYQGRTDEFGMLHQQFEEMVTEINDLIKHNYENEILMKDAQLMALEMQINPHFLYNTLESVNWRAKAIGETTISKMVESLGQLLRKTLSNKKEENTLKDELELANCYMTITKLRFEDQMDYQCHVPEKLQNALLPKLTLQPLVENAVHYALEEISDQCHIFIEAELQEENLIIRVSNDGSQFDEDLLDKLETQQIIPRGLGIGLRNIHERLKLFFGAEDGIRFYNQDEFAVAEICIPYHPAK